MMYELAIQFLADKRNFIIYPVTPVCVIAAIIYFLRLIAVLVFRSRKEQTEYEYKGLMFLTVCIGIVWHPYFDFPKNWVVFVGVSWMFSLCCVLIEAKITSGKSWEDFFGVLPQGALKAVNSVRRFFSAIYEKYSLRSRESKTQFLINLCVGVFKLALVNLVVVGLYPQIIWGLLLIWWMISFSVGLYRCMFRCKSFSKFWLVHALAIFLFFAAFLGNLLPKATEIESIPAAYWCICIMFSFFWCFGAVIADHDVTKMAGRIVNTLSTLLLFAVNVFLRSYREILGIINPALLPVVGAGYLAALFSDGIEYCRKRYEPPITAEDGQKEDKTEREES